MKSLHILAALVMLFSAQPATCQDEGAKLAALLKGASLVAQDEEKTFLGTIDNSFGVNSIFNEFSKYGSKFSADSIFNEFGKFGGEFSRLSPFNNFTNTPPMIIKNGAVIGYLTANAGKHGGISLAVLRSIANSM
jgi:hypothetical protein